MELIILIVCLVGLLVGTYTDIRTREVPDWINYGLIFLGFSFALFFSVLNKDWRIIVQSIMGFGAFYLIALLMYYTGQWGGGDSKMIMGLGALIGLPLMPKEWLSSFLTSFIFYTIIFGAVWGLVWSLGVAIKNRKRFVLSLKEQLKHISKIKLLFFGFVFVFIKAIEESLIEKTPVSKLVEGDWINEDVVVKGKVICSTKDLSLTKEQLAELKKHKIKYVMVKEGVPFVPSFLFAFLAVFFYGSLF